MRIFYKEDGKDTQVFECEHPQMVGCEPSEYQSVYPELIAGGEANALVPPSRRLVNQFTVYRDGEIRVEVCKVPFSVRIEK